MPPPPRKAWRFVWIVFLTGYVVTGGIGLRTLQDRVKASAPGPLNSTDTVFRMTTATEDASAKIARCIENVPPDRAIAVVYWNESRTLLAALQLGTLLWPHPAPQIGCQPGERLDASKLKQHNVHGVFMVGTPIESKDHPRLQSLGPLLHYYEMPRSK